MQSQFAAGGFLCTPEQCEDNNGGQQVEGRMGRQWGQIMGGLDLGIGMFGSSDGHNT